jgi:fructosamine-3-kinase
MPEGTSGDDALRASLREVGRADGITACRRLSGGVIADAWLITWADGTSAVGKIVHGAAPDLFRTEAGVHRDVVSDRFGWPADGWLGRLRQVNTWNADGHEFFAEHRLLRYLTEPPAEQALTADDRHAVERLCARLPRLSGS